ncbi:MAG: InlB B-repeat-containing protein, partial [Intestinibacter sp.]|uniref:InlB B-repeat-containing protein n=1 Tax=Intestinibacter sp. TaxID=1965304 RepID=UPI002A822770
WAIDPSGYIYEAVPSNRLRGVTVTAYTKDENGNTVKWDAADYDQVNPLTTDKEGKYAWDVPEGQWQVKCEKDGYETVYSDWLPVPPPQTDINIGMVSKEAPTVEYINIYKDYAEVKFNKYMKSDTVTNQSVSISTTASNIEISDIEAVDEDDTTGVKLATLYRVKFKNELNGNDVYKITLNKSITSYADVQMKNDYIYSANCINALRDIITEENISCNYGKEVVLNLQLDPAENESKYELECKSSSSDIASVKNIGSINEEGKAQITVNANLPGDVDLIISVKGVSVQKTVHLNVGMEDQSNKVNVVFNPNNGENSIEKEASKDSALDYTPQIPVKNGYVFVGWFKDVDDITTEYKSGNTYTEDVTYTAKYAHVNMLGAQVKAVVDNKSGIRFGTRIYDDGDEIVEKGTLILPANLLADGEALTLETPKAARSVGKVNYEVNEEKNYVIYLGTIINIPNSQFDTNMTASSYVIYKDKSGNEYTVYSPYKNGSTTINKLLGVSK